MLLKALTNQIILEGSRGGRVYNREGGRVVRHWGTMGHKGVIVDEFFHSLIFLYISLTRGNVTNLFTRGNVLSPDEEHKVKTYTASVLGAKGAYGGFSQRG